ncbi:MAG: hypothetical protein HQK87_02290 [Nitrospinae bacterium]|nr:hypothetical protein [Nitrospinota bacterium]
MKNRPSSTRAIRRPLRGRRGAVLVMSLLLLAMITILGVYAATRTAVEEKVAGANASYTSVFYMSEAALSHARKMLTDAYIEDTYNQQAANNATISPNWSFALDGSLYPPAAANIYCSTGCTDSAGLVVGAWIDGGVTVVDQTKTVNSIDYTYTVTLYDNNDAGAQDVKGNTCPAVVAPATDATSDCDGVVIVRATARAWQGGTLLAESIQEESMGTTLTNVTPINDTTGGEGGKVGKTSTSDDTGEVDMTGGGQVM